LSAAAVVGDWPRKKKEKREEKEKELKTQFFKK